MDLKLTYINIRSLRNKITEIETMLINDNIDILCLTETWLYDNEIQNFSIKGFNMIYNCRSTRGGGILIYIKSNFSFETKIIETFFENEIVIIKINENKTNIGVIYRKPSSDINIFLNYFDQILCKFKKLYLVGDLNINLFDNSLSVQNYNNIVIGNGYEILNRLHGPTRIDEHRHTETLIDHLISDIKLQNENILVILNDYILSDHKKITLEIKNFLRKNKKNIKQKYEIKDINFNKVKTNIKNRLQLEDLSEINFEKLNKIIKEEIDKNSTTKKTNYCFNLKQGWFTKTLSDLIKQRNNFFNIFKKHPDNIYVQNKLSELKKKIRNQIHYSKKKFYQNRFEKTLGNPKKTWNILKEFENKNININYNLNDENGNIISNPYNIANTFNNHFTNVAPKIIKQYSIPTKQKIVYFKNENASMYIKKTDENEILEIISNLKSNVSSGLDNIKISHIKKIKEVIAFYISYIINKNIDNNNFPKELKKAKITPVFKEGNRNDINNYRPISVLSVFSKIYEKLLYNRLLSYLNSIKFLSPLQHGFLKGKNTEIAVVELFEYLYKEIDKKNNLVGLFLDFRKAFDVVNHEILLSKMYNIGIRNKPFYLYKNYLEDRYQVTMINNIQSDPKNITFGVPQGSILGPLLFLIYINDIAFLKLKGKLSIYADDVALFYSGSENMINESLKNDLVILENWSNLNIFFLNENKCYYINFSETNMRLAKIKVNDKEIKKVDKYKYLGLIIDSKLTFKDHINYLINKLSQWTGLFRRFAFYLNNQTRKLLYYSYIQSNLFYLTCIWGACNKSDLERLQRCQNKVIKILYNFKYDMSTVLVYEKTNFFNLSDIIHLQNVKLIHKIKNNLINTNLILTSRNQIHQHNTRTCTNLNFESTKTSKAKNAVTHNGLILYNNLPDGIKSTLNIKLFIKNVKSYIVTKRNQH